VRAGLTARGHAVDPQPDWSGLFGGAQGVAVDPGSGMLSGGADPRRDGYAVGW
jgi:gamma-glutamyltranspeptidase/glutathione hydrolase